MSIIDRFVAAGRAAYSAFAPEETARSVPPDVPTGSTSIQNSEAQLAPWPLTDRYPTILGSSITMSGISAIMRLAITGYRQQYVDLLNELLEREPHGFAVLSQRILTIAGGRVDITTAECADDRKELASEIADFVQCTIKAIPDFKQAIAGLMWAIYNGVSACEVGWTVEHGMWKPNKLSFIHSRRLSFPDPSTWDLHIWDQGQVRGWQHGYGAPTQKIFGLRMADYPGKFIVHSPQLRGDYPTRDGLGRELIYWFAIKAMAARAASHYIERFGKPWPIAHYTTGSDSHPRAAEQDDITKADAAMRALGLGSLAGATLPDSIKVELFGPGQKGAKIAISHESFISLINAEISKAVQGQTFTTETGKFGSRSTADVGESSALRLGAFDAACLAETIRRDLVHWIVKLNWPDAMDLLPEVRVHIEAEPDASELIRRASVAAGAGIAIDGDSIGRTAGLPLTPNEDGKPRRMVPIAPAPIAVLDDEMVEPVPPEPPSDPANEQDDDEDDDEDEDEEVPAAAE